MQHHLTERTSDTKMKKRYDPRMKGLRHCWRVALVMMLALAGFASTIAPAYASRPPLEGDGSPLQTPSFDLNYIDPYAADEEPGCLAWVEQPGVVDFKKFIMAAYPGTANGGIHACTGGEHGEGRAWDWMLDAYSQTDMAKANAVLDWLLAPDAVGHPHAMARRIGLKYIIWNRRFLSLIDGESHSWVAYTGTNPHTNHIHFSFSWPGARRETTWYRAGTTNVSSPAYSLIGYDRGIGMASKWYVDTFANAPGFNLPGGARTGTLWSGTSYVYCKVWGPIVQPGGAGADYNHWWLKTDLDEGGTWQSQWVSAFYLSRWGNDVAKDNNGNDIPNCDTGSSPPNSKWWVDTFASAAGYNLPGGSRTGTLYAQTNYVYCKAWGPIVQVGSDYNHWWLKTDLDAGSPWQNQWVSAYYLTRWGNDVAKDNSGNVIPDCQ